MATRIQLILLFPLIFIGFTSFAQIDRENPIDDNNMFDLSLEELLNIEIYDDKFKLYGFLNSNVEKVYNVPGKSTEGITISETEPVAWSPVQNFHIYGSVNLTTKIFIFFNLARTESEGVEIRNAFGNFKIADMFQIRTGKMYRRFGIYNEKLDQIPTFIGIEPPELFDQDHLFLERTTNFMIHGEYDFVNGKASYALSTDNGEGGPSKGIIPLGWDFRYQSGQKGIVIGTSGYSTSINGEKATSTVTLGNGSPRGGVLPWMQGDNFTVWGGFIEKQFNNLILQSAYWIANHKAIRDPQSVLTVVHEAGINAQQRENFLGLNANKSDDDLTINDVVRQADYRVQTYYLRLGYNISSKIGQFIPYMFIDWMSNPEVIQNKTYGGDNEAGLADDGQFYKSSIGVVYRPIKNVAVKLDGSMHTQEFNNTSITYPEVRLDFSFSFDAFKTLGQL